MKKSEKTRLYIIEKVAPVFNKKGYVGASLSEMTSATGLTKGSIYGNFRDKNEVAVEAFRYNWDSLRAEVRVEVERRQTAGDKLRGFTDFYKNNFKRIFENGGCAILNTAVDADDSNPALKKEAANALESWKLYLMNIIEDGVRKSELKPTDAERFACKMIAAIEGTIMLAKTTGKTQYLQYNIEQLEEEIRRVEAK